MTGALPARYANGRFGPGNPGRRAGSRNRVSHKALMLIMEDFEANKAQVLDRLRTHSPGQYFNTLSRLLPTQLIAEGSELDELPPQEAAQICASIRRVLAISGDSLDSLREIEKALTRDKEP